jgi:hypothetical protein
MNNRIWYRLVMTIAAFALTLTAAVATSPPAQAYTCSGGRTLTVTGTASRTTITFYPECSDNRSHWHGTLWDTSCDAKAARVSLIANQAFGYWQWDRAHTAGNGCGTSASYSGSDASVIDYRGSSWLVEVGVGACNFWSCVNFTRGYLHA